MGFLIAGPANLNTAVVNVQPIASGVSEQYEAGVHYEQITTGDADHPDGVTRNIPPPVPLYGQRLTLPVSLPDRSSETSSRSLVVELYLVTQRGGIDFGQMGSAATLGTPEGEPIQGYLASFNGADSGLTGEGLANGAHCSYEVPTGGAVTGVLDFEFGVSRETTYGIDFGSVGLDGTTPEQQLADTNAFYETLNAQHPGWIRDYTIAQGAVPEFPTSMWRMFAEDRGTAGVNVYEVWNKTVVVPPPPPVTTTCPAHLPWPYTAPTLTVSPDTPGRIRRSRP